MLFHLEALRGICAIWVAAAHVAWPVHGLVVLHEASWLAVNVFFVLSGFIMSRTYAAKPKFDAIEFMQRRFWRLYPLHLVTMSAFLGLVLARQYVLPALTGWRPSAVMTDDIWWHALLNATFLQAVGLLDKGLLNVPSWSIAVEFWTYIVFAAVCVAVRSPAGRTVAMAGIGTVALVTLLGIAGDAGQLSTITWGLLRCLWCFNLGSLVWLVSTRLAPLSNQAIVAGMALTIVGIVAALAVHWMTVATATIAPLIGLLALDRGTIIRRTLEWRPLVLLGTWSYSIYMVHMLIMTTMTRMTEGRISDPWVGDALLFVYLAMVVAVAGVTHRWIEAPWRRSRRHECTTKSKETVGANPPER